MTSFLKRLKKEEKLGIAEPSENISLSYLHKSEQCMRAAKILHKEGIFENAVAEAYYGMYNATLSLLFRNGIKCESHTGTIIILREIFQLSSPSSILKKAKKERIDKQYYISDSTIAITESQEFIEQAEQFILQIRLEIRKGYKKEYQERINEEVE